MPDTVTQRGTIALGAKLPPIVMSSPVMEEAAKGMLDEQKNLNAALPAAQAQVESRRADMQGELAKPTPTPPKLQDVPQFQPKEVSAQDLNVFAGLAMAFAGLGTKIMRGDMTMALNAAAGAMRGFNEGRHEQATEDLRNFKAKMDGVIAENTKMTNEYRAIIEDRKLSLSQKEQALRVAAAARDDQITLSALKTGQLKAVFDLEAHRINAGNQVAIHLEQIYAAAEARRMAMQNQMDIAKLRFGGGAPLAPEELASVGAQAATGMPLAQIIPGYGQAVARQRQQARSAAIQHIMQETGRDAAYAGAELARRTLDFNGIKGSVGQLEKMYGATQQAVAQLDFNIKKTTEAMDKLGGSDISPVINAIARGSEKWTGDPAYSELFFFMNAAGMESARILSGGQASIAQLHEGAREEAKHWADANLTTPAAWKEGIAPAMLAEGHNRLQNFEQAIALQRGRLPGGSSLPKGGAGIPTFATEADAERAGLAPGTRVMIGGKTGTWH